MGLFSLISTTFDPGKSALLARYLQRKLGDAGTASNLVLDSQARTLAFDLALRGELEPLCVETAYSVERNQHGTWLTIRQVKTSREWADILAKRFLKNPIKVPDAVRLVI